MFGMGITLTGGDFKRVLLRPKDVGNRVLAQYGVMPILGVVLAESYFGTLAALPGAMFSVWHNISDSVLAWWWRRDKN